MSKIAIVFPGQGSQAVGMCKDIFDKHDSIKAMFKEVDSTLGFKLTDIMFNGPEEELKLTHNTQPAIVSASLALFSLVKDKLGKVDYFAGHSLGEYSALSAAGAVSFKDVVLAVHNRGKFMQEAVPVGVGAMAAIVGHDSDDEVMAACKAVSVNGVTVEAANFNCPGQLVISGHKAGVEAVVAKSAEFAGKRVKAIMLPVSAPFHSSLMKPARDKMEAYLKNVHFNDLQAPVVVNVDATALTDKSKIIDTLSRQITGSVRWTESVNYLVSQGVTKFIEVGPGKVLTGMIGKINKDVEVMNISNADDVEKL